MSDEKQPNYEASEKVECQNGTEFSIEAYTFDKDLFIEGQENWESYTYMLLETKDECIELEMTKDQAIQIVTTLANSVGMQVGLNTKKQMGDLITKLQLAYDQMET